MTTIAKLVSLMLAASLTACTVGSKNDEPSGIRAGDPIYAVMYEVFDQESSNSYLGMTSSLDIESIDPRKSREFAGGRAYIQAYNGWVFIGEPATPIVTRYSVEADGTLTDPREIDFGNFGLTSGTIDPWSLTFIGPEKAYLFDFAEMIHIIWNPTTMKIVGQIDPPEDFFREGFTTDGSPGVVRGNRLYRDIYWTDWDTVSFSEDHMLLVYDVENDELLDKVTETRCPAPGNLIHQDEQGALYFSSWIWPLPARVMHGAPAGCILKVEPGEDKFSDWTLPYSELAEGREGAVFSYTGNGKGMVSIFHDEDAPFDDTTDPFEYAGSLNWHLYEVDLDARSATPIDGIPPNAGAYTPAQFDERSLVMIPTSTDWNQTRIFDVSRRNGTPSAKSAMTVPGWTYALLKVR